MGLFFGFVGVELLGEDLVFRRDGMGMDAVEGHLRDIRGFRGHEMLCYGNLVGDTFRKENLHEEVFVETGVVLLLVGASYGR